MARANSDSQSSRRQPSQRTSKAVREVAEERPSSHDGFATVLIGLAIVIALREWFQLSGALGNAIHHGTAGIVGRLSIFVPILLVAIAV